MSTMEKVFVAIYEHKHGMDVCVFTSEAKATKWREVIATEWWPTELPDQPMPDDVDERTEAYWQVMSDRGQEFFNIEEKPLE